MADNYVGFLDAGVLRALQPKYFRPQAEVILDWFAGLSATILPGERFLRLYWYDGRFDPSHDNYEHQRHFFSAIGRRPGIQLRLGHIIELPDGQSQKKKLQQKGVDTLLTLDLVRLAGRAVCTTAVVLVRDRDFTEAIRAAQDFGVRVLIATPNRHSVPDELHQVADGMIEIPKEVLQIMMPPRRR